MAPAPTKTTLSNDGGTVDRREQSEWTEAAADDSTDARDSDLDPEEIRGEATVAHRLSRVTRYATGAADKSDPVTPDSEPDQEERQGPSSAETPQPGPAPAGEAGLDSLSPEQGRQEPEDAQHDAETAEAMQEDAVQGEEAEPGLVFADEARPEPAPYGDPPQTAAPAEEALQDHAAFEEEQPDPAPREAAPEELVFSDIAEHLGIAGPSPSGPEPAAPASVPSEQSEVAPAAAATEQQQPQALQNQDDGPPAGAPEQQAPVAEPPAPMAQTGPDDSEVLTVGRGIRLVAKLCECAELLVEGHLEATARTRQLQLAKSGRFIGSAEVEYAEIHGNYEGELTVSEKLYISPTGSVSGTTRYREIVIEAGGQIMGNTQHLPDEGEAVADGAEA